MSTETKPTPATEFSTLRPANIKRCVEDFGHTLNSWSPAEWTNAMCGEAGEAANVAKKMLRHRDSVKGNRGADTDIEKLREKLASELADTVIYADLTAASQGINLDVAVMETFNRKSEEIGSPVRLVIDSGCADGHPEIRYTGDRCPLCEALLEAQFAVRDVAVMEALIEAVKGNPVSEFMESHFRPGQVEDIRDSILSRPSSAPGDGEVGK